MIWGEFNSCLGIWYISPKLHLPFPHKGVESKILISFNLVLPRFIHIKMTFSADSIIWIVFQLFELILLSTALVNTCTISYVLHSPYHRIQYLKMKKDTICLNFWDDDWWFLSLRVFGLLSLCLLLFPQRFGWYVLRPSSGVCRTRKPSRNFELRPLLNPGGLPVLILGTRVKYSCMVTRLQSGLNLQPPDDWLLRSLGN